MNNANRLHTTRNLNFNVSGRSAGIGVFVTVWFGIFLYDWLVLGYAVPSSEYGVVRSLLLVAGLIPFFIHWIKPKQMPDDGEAYRLSYRLLGMLYGTIAVVTVLNFLKYAGPDSAVPDTFGAFFVTRLVALLALVWLAIVCEQLIRLLGHRSRMTPSPVVKVYGWAIVLGIAATQIFHDTYAYSTFLRYATVGTVVGTALVLVFRLSWIINLRKGQKYKLLGIAILGIIAGGLLVSNHEEQVAGQAIYTFFPGLGTLTFFIGLTLVLLYLSIFFYALFSLPTADAIDRRNTEVSSLANFSKLLTESFDIEHLVDAAVKIAADVTASSVAWVEMERGESREFLFGSGQNLPKSIVKLVINAPANGRGGPLVQVVRENREVNVASKVNGASWVGKENAPRALRSAAAAPLQSGEKLLGILYVAKERLDDFDRGDTVILAAVADQITLALEHSSLIQRSIEKERLDQEMAIARSIQQRLLPSRMPESPLYDIYAESEPASMVGGDYYDVVGFNNQTLGLLVADVSGKGASAALYMGMVKGIIQALSGTCADPKELLVQTNSSLFGNIDARSFVTMTCAQILEEEGTLRIARAGHCPTLVIKDGVGRYSRPNGFGLSLVKPGSFARSLEQEEIEVDSGDYVIFFSDGLAEAMREDGEELGYERLQEIACNAAASCDSPRELRDAIFAGISTFTEGMPLADDSTIVILRWR